MKLNERIAQRTRLPVPETISAYQMTSTTPRYPIKPKNLTLLEVCHSISDFRHPPPSLSSYQSQASSTAAQILTRRLYLHPLTINSNQKQQSSKSSTTTTVSTPPEGEQHHTKLKSPHQGLAILSSSLPLITRINPKPETRHSRDKASVKSDDDTNSDHDNTNTMNFFNQSSLLSIARGTTSSTHTICTRPSCIKNHQKIYPKTARRENIDVWNHFDRALQRPMPMDPPTTPLSIASGLNIENDEIENQYFNYNSIQQIKTPQRNPIYNFAINETDEDYIYYENEFIQ